MVESRDGDLEDSHLAPLSPTPDRQAHPRSRNQAEALELVLLHCPPHHHRVSIGEPEEGLLRHEPLYCPLAVLTAKLRVHQQIGGIQVVSQGTPLPRIAWLQGREDHVAGIPIRFRQTLFSPTLRSFGHDVSSLRLDLVYDGMIAAAMNSQ